MPISSRRLLSGRRRDTATPRSSRSPVSATSAAWRLRPSLRMSCISPLCSVSPSAKQNMRSRFVIPRRRGRSALQRLRTGWAGRLTARRSAMAARAKNTWPRSQQTARRRAAGASGLVLRKRRWQQSQSSRASSPSRAGRRPSTSTSGWTDCWNTLRRRWLPVNLWPLRARPWRQMRELLPLRHSLHLYLPLGASLAPCALVGQGIIVQAL